ncbi:MAG: hypothetical protein JO197_00405 [Acidobacteria bacterium]|nr:hypothetical protein [Acidobacteriota bacterium]MBV9474703.1 hypothetical protein [Acidobacteriota bacterium]
MWVFDGETWTQDDGNDFAGTTAASKPEKPRQWVDEFVPELQVIEIVQVPRNTHVPPLPLP